MGEDERERDGEGRRKEETRRGCGEKEEKVSRGREARVRSWRKGAKRTRGSDSGPVINEESNFQAGDLTSSRPTVGGCYSMRDGAREGGGRERPRRGLRGRAREMRYTASGCLDVAAEPPGRDDWTKVGSMAGD